MVDMPHGLTTAPANPAPGWPLGYIEALREDAPAAQPVGTPAPAEPDR